jgi:hypothetical protein
MLRPFGRATAKPIKPKEDSMQAKLDQMRLFAAGDPPYVRICPQCGYPCHDPERNHCRDGGARSR